MDTCARALLAAARMLEDGALEAPLRERYAAWDTADARKLLAGEYPLAEIERRVLATKVDPEPRSGKQELLENIVSRYL
jgi:xylose isomerase